MALAALLLLSPGLARGQSGPEGVLPARSQLFFRWDGSKAHREEFQRTAFGKSLQGDTGKFLKELWNYAKDNIEQAINQKDPQAAEVFKDATLALTDIVQGGIVLGVELDKVNPPKANAVLVFPGAADETSKLLMLIQKAADAGRADVKNVMVGRRRVHQIEIEGANGLFVGWWQEGKDAVVTFGTTEPGEYAKLIDAKQTGIAKQPLFKKVQGYKEFTTSTRGYLDVPAIIGVVEDVSPEAAKLVDALGVKGLKGVTFASGYDGIAFRSVLDVDMPGPRDGLLALTSTKKFSLKDLPALPSDATSFSASTLDIGKSYDVLLNLVEAGLRIFAPDAADNVRGTIQGIEGAVGVKFREEIFGNFGDLAVSYSSPAEGPLGLGSTTLLKVKNGPQLMKAIETLVTNVGAMIPNVEVNLKKKKYRDVEMMDLYFKAEQFSTRLGTFAVHKGWFIYSQYPQGVKGFALRSSGELPAWKASEDLNKALAHFPKEFVAIQVSDPRRTAEFLYAVSPFAIDLANKLTGFVPNLRPFDIDLVPHAQEATQYLFPRVTVTTDDGKKLRSETRSSVGLP
jgi:hypothetical protein